MSISEAQRRAYRQSWRRLVEMVNASIADPAKPACYQSTYATAAYSKWVSPAGGKPDGSACAAFALVAADYARTTTVQERARKAAALSIYADIVAEVLDRTEDPGTPAPTEPASTVVMRRRLDIDGPADE